MGVYHVLYDMLRSEIEHHTASPRPPTVLSEVACPTWALMSKCANIQQQRPRALHSCWCLLADVKGSNDLGFLIQ